MCSLIHPEGDTCDSRFVTILGATGENVKVLGTAFCFFIFFYKFDNGFLVVFTITKHVSA